MAQLVQIRLPNCESNCDLDAAFELRDRKNELRGRYCAKHAKLKLRSLHLEENGAPFDLDLGQDNNSASGSPTVEALREPAKVTLPEPRRAVS